MTKGQTRLSNSALQSNTKRALGKDKDKDKDKFINNDSQFNWINYAELHGESCAHCRPHFLAWHRIYIHYFEEALRSITAETTFTLPSWNYNVPAQRKLPEAFADSTSASYENQEKKTATIQQSNNPTIQQSNNRSRKRSSQ